jgi:TP901 family phage tail tape measure protein
MAKKEVSILLRLKNELDLGLAKARKSLSSFASSVGSVGKSIAKGLGAGIAATGAAIGAAMVRTQEFSKQIGQIASISEVSMKKASKEIRKLSAEFGLAKTELTKGVYDALSAGIPSQNVFEFMRVASKAAIAGAATTAETVDFLTTAINAYGKEAKDAQSISDTFFETIRLGKTTASELAASFADVAPIASASGVAFEEVMGSIANLTSQGTKTAQATTQIKSAIIAMNEVLGDGWSKTMSLQDAYEALWDASGRSASGLKDLVGRQEAANAVLQSVGEKSAAARDKMLDVADAAGAMEKAFAKMKSIAVLDRFKQSVDNLILVVGEKALAEFGPLIDSLAVKMQGFGQTLETFFDSQKWNNIKQTIEGTVRALAGTGDQRGEAMRLIGDVIKTQFTVAAQRAGELLAKYGPVIGGAIGSAAARMIKEAIKPGGVGSISAEEETAARRGLGLTGREYNAAIQTKFDPLSRFSNKEATETRKQIEAFVRELRNVKAAEQDISDVNAQIAAMGLSSRTAEQEASDALQSLRDFAIGVNNEVAESTQAQQELAVQAAQDDMARTAEAVEVHSQANEEMASSDEQYTAAKTEQNRVVQESNEQAQEASVSAAQGAAEAIVGINASRLANEQSTLASIVAANISAASEVIRAWEEAHSAQASGQPSGSGSFGSSGSSGSSSNSSKPIAKSQKDLVSNPGNYRHGRYVFNPNGSLDSYTPAAKGRLLAGPSSGFAAQLHGSEAVLPVRRGRNGILGVSAIGGGGNDDVVKELRTTRRQLDKLLRWS